MPGFATTFVIIPHLSVGVFSLVNTWKFPDSIAKQLAELIIKRESSSPSSGGPPDPYPLAELPEVRLAEQPSENLKDFTGIYLFDTDTIMWVEWL